MRPSRRWKDLSRSQRAAIITLGSIEAALTTGAAVDLCRRPQEQLRGPKALWWPAIFVQPLGPIAYLRLARRPSDAAR
jgi:hypothetical protein